MMQTLKLRVRAKFDFSYKGVIVYLVENTHINGANTTENGYSMDVPCVHLTINRHMKLHIIL